MLSLTSPALLFPAISLLLLAYTNRFLTTAQLIRGLSERYSREHQRGLLAQIKNLRARVVLIRNMQAAGVSSLLVCVLCMFALFLGLELAGRWLFGASLLLMALSLTLSIVEIQISTRALELELERTAARFEDEAE